MPPADLTQRFLLENLDIRGQVIRLGPLWQAILSRHEYPQSLHQLLGEFATVAVLVGSGLKHPGRAVLQIIGQGPIAMAVADCTHELALRAMLRQGERTAMASTATPSSVHDYFPTGRLALTIENTTTARHFQSVVPIEGTTLAECFERYFDRSEQVPTHLWVQASAAGAGALMLQKLPKADEKDPSGWARIQQQAARGAPAALGCALDGDLSGLLSALFPEDDVRIFKPQAIKDGCVRSEEKVVAMLRSLGRAEVEATLAEHGVVKVHDEICNQEYRFTAKDVARIFES